MKISPILANICFLQQISKILLPVAKSYGKLKYNFPSREGKLQYFSQEKRGKRDYCCCSLPPQGLQPEETLVQGAGHSEGTEPLSCLPSRARGVAKVSVH